MLVRHQARLAILHLFEKLKQRFRRRQLDAQRQRIDEQSNHRLDAGNLRWSARHRHTKDHVIAPGQTPKQDRPRRLEERIERQTLPARLPPQRCAEPLAQRNRDLLGRQRYARPIGGRHTRGFFHARQSLPPGRHRAGAILRRDPRQVIAVGLCRRQRRAVSSPRRLIDFEQLAQQDRHRPAVQQDVVEA